MKRAICSVLTAALLAAAPAARAETWWRLGSTTDNHYLYIDADSVSVDDEGYGSYRGMFVYRDLWTRDTGETVRYEVFRMGVDCLMGELYEEHRQFYGDNRGLVMESDSDEVIFAESGKASGWEEDFVCGSSSSWSGKGYYPVSDPVSDGRGW